MPIPTNLTAHEYWDRLRKPLELELARGCADSAIAGMSLGAYTQAWATRWSGGDAADEHLTQALARGLRDYATLPIPERRRRVLSALDLLRGRAPDPRPSPPARSTPAPARPAPAPAPPPPPSPAARPARKARKAPAPDGPERVESLPTGDELLNLPLALFAPRASWPKALERLNLYTVRDLLYHLPREWVPIQPPQELQDGARAVVVSTVVRQEYEKLKAKQSPQPLYKYLLTLAAEGVELWVASITPEAPRGAAKRWSPACLPFTPGQRVCVMGRVERTGKLIELRLEDIYLLTEAQAAHLTPGRALPLYPLTQGVYQNQVHRAVLRALAALGRDGASAARLDPLPAALRAQFGLLPLLEALHEVHWPSSRARHEAARHRLTFDEFLLPQLLLARARWTAHAEGGAACVVAESMADLVARLAPFPPTAAQRRVLGEIEADLRAPAPMGRLLQGDVGAGKTLVAAAALALAIRAGQQAAMMAPTEILAEQLALVLGRLLRPLGIAPVLLTGSSTAAEKREALAALATGRAPLAVGTHALIQEGVTFQALGLVIVDEQHRFGVVQRASLCGKGTRPNLLVMTATPIPRTLALTLYGDLDISLLDELPPGRHPVETRWLSLTKLKEAYAAIRAGAAQGLQAYVVCPLVEESDLLQADAATGMAQELQARHLADLQIGLLHGRMRPAEKDAAMEAFRAGQTQVLVCTTVIEVGVDVPTATTILIHNAERFGLSQLHQLRGRVGRSAHPSVCYLATHPRFDPANPEGEELPGRARLRVLVEEQDGFAIAERDLELRGPGEYLGTRQAGLGVFGLAHLRDTAALEGARAAAQALITADPDLADPAHAALRARAHRLKARLDELRA
jgi:ATP-dependent DNA helicase RecG